MADRSNYRVKVDLSKYCQDARRFSWIYVNSANIWFIANLKCHIKDVFRIDDPFHLLLNGTEYLPPVEDVRVLNENETIVVQPGSGVFDQNRVTGRMVTAMSLPSSDMENGFLKSVSTSEEKVDIGRKKGKKEILDAPYNRDQTSNSSMSNSQKADATMYHSIMDFTAIESDIGTAEKYNGKNLNFNTITPHDIPSHKRKRVRRKKLSKQGETSLNEIINNNKEDTNFNKPKIVNSYTVPDAIHIRFDNLEDNAVNAVENGVQTAEKNNEQVNSNACSSPFAKNSKIEHLSSLLALKNCSSPLMFVNKKPKYADSKSSEVRTEPEVNVRASNSSKDELQNVENVNEYSKFLNEKPEDHPPLESEPEINDIIAFKILNMGSGYIPQISNYIIAKTSNRSGENISFRILKGQSEFEGPSGKFSLPEDEAENVQCDTVELTFAQLHEPRLIHRVQI